MKPKIKWPAFLIILLFSSAFCLASAAYSFGAVEIVVEYNPPQGCTGNVQLTLTPSSTAKGAAITPLASGLTACDSFVVYFRTGSCTGSTVSQCTIPTSGTNCTGPTFSAPSTLGTYTYYACVDKNKNSLFTDAGDSDSKILTVTNAIPTESPLVMGSSVVDLIGDSKRTINFSATVTDGDGYSDITSCKGYVWNSTVGSPFTVAKSRYANSSCQLTGCSGNACLCTCSFGLMYYDVNGTWTANVTVFDSTGNNVTSSGTFTVNPMIYITVANAYGDVSSSNPLIQFDTLYVGDNNRAASSNPLKIVNSGNVNVLLKISGSDHVGKSDSTWVLKVGNMSYNSSATGMGALIHLSSTSTNFYPSGGIPVYPNSAAGISEQGVFYVNNYLTIPDGWKAQSYTGTYVLEVGAV